VLAAASQTHPAFNNSYKRPREGRHGLVAFFFFKKISLFMSAYLDRERERKEEEDFMSFYIINQLLSKQACLCFF
jgi:hypothetical protein